MTRLVTLLTPAAPAAAKLPDAPASNAGTQGLLFGDFQALIAQEMASGLQGRSPLDGLSQNLRSQTAAEDKTGAAEDAANTQPLFAWFGLAGANGQSAGELAQDDAARGNGGAKAASLLPQTAALAGSAPAESPGGKDSAANLKSGMFSFARGVKQAVAQDKAITATPSQAPALEMLNNKDIAASLGSNRPSFTSERKEANAQAEATGTPAASQSTAIAASKTLPEAASGKAIAAVANASPQVIKAKDMLNPGMVAASLHQQVPAQNLTTVRPPEVASPFGAKEWQQDFTQQVTLIAKQGIGSAEIKLNPPQLGPVEVSISIRNDQAQASFASPHAPVRDAIEASLPHLRQMLADVGITLSNANVSPDLAQAQSAFAGFNRDHSQRAQTERSGEQRTGANADRNEATVVVRSRLGRVDTFV